MTFSQSTQPRVLNAEELAALVKIIRDIRKWSQELLSEISGLSVRTIQRVENGQSSGLDTRRALARAFDFEDIDALSKPYHFPTEEEINAEREKFDRENITLKALPLTSGKMLAQLAETTSLDLITPGFEMPREAEETFACLADYFREYRDCADLYQEREKLDIHDWLQGSIDRLKELGVSLCYASRNVAVKFKDGTTKPIEMRTLYLVTFPLGEEPAEFATPREMPICF
jgi:transcriptional regulator with XRE-family HTH domain